jgi:hypothetical protein
VKDPKNIDLLILNRDAATRPPFKKRVVARFLAISIALSALSA